MLGVLVMGNNPEHCILVLENASHGKQTEHCSTAQVNRKSFTVLPDVYALQTCSHDCFALTMLHDGSESPEEKKLRKNRENVARFRCVILSYS